MFGRWVTTTNKARSKKTFVPYGTHSLSSLRVVVAVVFLGFFRIFLLTYSLIIATFLERTWIFTFLNELRLILHGNMHIQSSTTIEVHRTLIGLNDCFSSCYILSLWFDFPWISAGSVVSVFVVENSVIFICSIFSPAFMEVIRFLSLTPASVLPILLCLSLCWEKSNSSTEQKLELHI